MRRVKYYETFGIPYSARVETVARDLMMIVLPSDILRERALVSASRHRLTRASSPAKHEFGSLRVVYLVCKVDPSLRKRLPVGSVDCVEDRSGTARAVGYSR